MQLHYIRRLRREGRGGKSTLWVRAAQAQHFERVLPVSGTASAALAFSGSRLESKHRYQRPPRCQEGTYPPSPRHQRREKGNLTPQLLRRNVVAARPRLGAGALAEAGRGEGLVGRLRRRREPKAELAGKVVIVGLHGQRQAHVLLEKLLRGRRQGCRAVAQDGRGARHLWRAALGLVRGGGGRKCAAQGPQVAE